MIKIIAVGKKSEYAEFIADYEKRLRAPFDLEWQLLPYSTKTAQEARNDESEQILSKLGDEYVILLDERGKELNNAEFTEILSNQSKNITIIIGGAYGVNDELRNRANFTISLGKLILPHQIVRLILVEQIYRSQCIIKNHPYHHE